MNIQPGQNYQLSVACFCGQVKFHPTLHASECPVAVANMAGYWAWLKIAKQLDAEGRFEEAVLDGGDFNEHLASLGLDPTPKPWPKQ